MAQHSTALVWFRSDLRVDDNSALSAAMANHARVTAVYCATPGQWRRHGLSPNRVDFIRRNLACLAGELQQLRVPLELVVVDDFSALPAKLQALGARLGVSAVYANREYGVDELARDDQVCAALSGRDIAWHCFDDSPVLTPGSVRTQAGEPFKVFTPFKRRWLQLLANRPFACERTPRPQAGTIPALSTFEGWRYPEATIDTAHWPAGEPAAHQRLRDFVEDGLADYKAQRDLPALDATSRLSPYLSLGVISVRRCMEAALAFNAGEWEGGNPGASCWINELVWREFYIHVLAAFPRVSRNRPFRAETEHVPWREDDQEFARWCNGRTGFPLVDAGMRQLVASGWMHNRVRMVTAMFLSKYLLHDWRRGEAFFMAHLVDGDLAANNGGWQWSASTGTDAAPYFRLLSPQRQAERFDAGADYIRRWVPELRDARTEDIFKPGSPSLLALGYPAPLVDLRLARERALAAFAKRAA